MGSKRQRQNEPFYQNRRAWLMAYKIDRGCDRCGYNKCAAALSFHHRDPATKLFHITVSNSTFSMALLEDEIAKCDLLCENCHREVENCG